MDMLDKSNYLSHLVQKVKKKIK